MVRLLPLVLFAVLAAGCGSARADQAGFIPPADRKPAPPVVAETVDGDSLALADLHGPVVVNFWASWCGPCTTEIPALQNVAEAYDGQVKFVGVNVNDNLVRAENVERDFDMTYPSWFDDDEQIAASFGGIGPAAMPSTLILDADHHVAVRLFGAVNEAQLSAQLDRVLAGESEGTS